MTMRDALVDYRKQFTAHSRYLNYASWGPPSETALTASASAGALAAAGAPDAVNSLATTYCEAHAAFARLTRFPSDQVTLVPTTSHGLLQIAFGLHNGQVLVNRAEFPANVVPWLRASARGLISARTVDAIQGVSPDWVKATVTAEDTAIAVSAVDYRTGLRADLAAIRDVIGPHRLLIVDAIQGLGAVDADWGAADVVVSGGQKWVRAGWGVGAMALSARALDMVRPTMASWAGVDDSAPEFGTPFPGAAGFQVSNLAPTAAAAFSAALGLIADAGIPQIERAIRERATQLIEDAADAGFDVLTTRDPAERAGIIIVNTPKGSGHRIHAALEAEGFTITWHGAERMRISLHATTPYEAITDLIAVLADATRP